jgi:hypothetical protein
MLEAFIARLKVAEMVALTATLVATGAGVTEVTVGAAGGGMVVVPPPPPPHPEIPSATARKQAIRNRIMDLSSICLGRNKPVFQPATRINSIFHGPAFLFGSSSSCDSSRIRGQRRGKSGNGMHDLTRQNRPIVNQFI